MSAPPDPLAAPVAPGPGQVQPLAGTEEEAWAAVEAAWADEAVHRAYLARFSDLEGIGVAGARYRAVLGARPDDAVARRMREAVVKKATMLGFAALPRTPARVDGARLRKVKRAVAFALGVALLYLGAQLFQQLAQLLGSKP